MVSYLFLKCSFNGWMIYLIGIPAVGKFTVAKEIGRMTGAKGCR